MISASLSLKLQVGCIYVEKTTKLREQNPILIE